MPVVPITARPPPAKGPRRLQDMRPPPSTPFALMAAAQMHKEGKLIPKSKSGGAATGGSAKALPQAPAALIPEGGALPPQLGGKVPG
jgi:hypothetical protein